MLLLSTLFIHYTHTRSYYIPSIMIDPAGDARYPGRTIDDTFERGISLQCAEKLKQEIERTFSHIRTVLTRFPGETIEPLQNASFANRLHVDLYLSIHFYYNPDAHPQWHIYYFSYHPTIDFWHYPQQTLLLTPYHAAHRQCINTTKKWAESLYNGLKASSTCIAHAPYSIPFRPLIGINRPAIALEMCLPSKDRWGMYIRPLVDALGPIIQEIQQAHYAQ